MKLFRLLTTTAITTMAVAAMAVSASAMTAEYVPAEGTETGKVTLAQIPEAKDGSQLTLLVLSEDAPQITEQNKGIITQIDQVDEPTGATKTVTVGDLLKAIDDNNQTIADAANADGKVEEAELANWIEKKTYYVRVGGVAETTTDKAFEAATFDVTTTVTKPTVGGGEEPPVSKWGLGDVDRSGGYPNFEDAMQVIYFDAELYDVDFDDEQLILADVNESGGWPDFEDAMEIIYFDAEMESCLDEYYGF